MQADRKISTIDRLYLALWLYAQGRSYWPGSTLAEGRRWLISTVQPLVERELGTGRIEDDHVGNALLRMMDATNYRAYRRGTSDLSAGYGEGNPFITALGKYNNVASHIIGEGNAVGPVGLSAIPKIYEKEDQNVYRAGGYVLDELHARGVERPNLKDYQHGTADIPWTLEQDGEQWRVTFDEEYEPHPLIQRIMALGVGQGTSDH